MIKYIIAGCSLILCMYASPLGVIAQETQDSTEHSTHSPSENSSSSHSDQAHPDAEYPSGEDSHGEHDSHDAHGAHVSPALWSIIPFVVLLILIATGPVFFEHFWHHNYKFIAPALGLITLIYYLFGLGDFNHPSHALSEYISFIALLAPLYIASGGILIQMDREGTPRVNSLLLLFGAVISNIIGTTGASMLLIRPFIRLNRDRLQPYHIVFFIFIVSNVGGSLTPIGDPPLFLGFLKGVPFEWTFLHVIPEWIFGIAMLTGIFYVIDSRNKKDLDHEESVYSGKFILRGTKNFIWLAVVIGAVFLDPNVLDWVPAIEVHGTKYSFLREIIQLTAGALSFYLADKQALRGNEFSFAPINEVVFLFAGIFFAMMPALQLIGEFAQSPAGKNFFNVDTIYWITGSLSGILDNAPTYLNFLSAALGKFGLSVSSIQDVQAFAAGSVELVTKDYLKAISVAAVFFGAMTYIGNGPNFMVKAIAEDRGVQMPSFFGYVVRYSLIYLLPVLFLTWLIFFKLL